MASKPPPNPVMTRSHSRSTLYSGQTLPPHMPAQPLMYSDMVTTSSSSYGGTGFASKQSEPSSLYDQHRKAEQFKVPDSNGNVYAGRPGTVPACQISYNVPRHSRLPSHNRE